MMKNVIGLAVAIGLGVLAFKVGSSKVEELQFQDASKSRVVSMLTKLQTGNQADSN